MGANAGMTQTEIKLDVTTYDAWVTPDLDFSAVSDSVDYDQIVVQLGGEGHSVPAQFYFDNLELLDPAGIEEGFQEHLNIYPNSASEYISFSVQDLELVRIFSFNGQLVRSKALHSGLVNIEDLEEGLYFVRILLEDGSSYSGRFIKK